MKKLFFFVVICSALVLAAKNAKEYCVIDLSGGPSATSYPVSYLDKAPDGGWSDEYRTTKLVLKYVAPGSFTMGSPTSEVGREPDEVSHQVTLSSGYYIGVFEVTQGQWELVKGDNPCFFTKTANAGVYPVDSVSYDMIRGSDKGGEWPSSADVDENSFLGIIRAKTGMAGFDLPTEAQWEYACRAGTESAFSNGGSLVSENGSTQLKDFGSEKIFGKSEETEKVGTYAANPWGLYDMHGSLLEWCLDLYAGPLSDEAVTDPKGSDEGFCHVLRGGSSFAKEDLCRSAARLGGIIPSDTCYDIGFRLALTQTSDSDSDAVIGQGLMQNASSFLKLLPKFGEKSSADNDEAEGSSVSSTGENIKQSLMQCVTLAMNWVQSLKNKSSDDNAVAFNSSSFASKWENIWQSIKQKTASAVDWVKKNANLSFVDKIKERFVPSVSGIVQDNPETNNGSSGNTIVDNPVAINNVVSNTAENNTKTDNTLTNNTVIGNTETDVTVTGNTETDVTVTGNTETDVTVTGNNETDVTVTGNNETDVTVTGNIDENPKGNKDEADNTVVETGTKAAEITAKKDDEAETVVVVPAATEKDNQETEEQEEILPATEGIYLVVDLSGGVAAESYPVRGSNKGPDLSNDACRTTELWLKKINAGTFMMGSPWNELGRNMAEIQHQVTLSNDYYIGIFEVTQKQYELVMGSNPSEHEGDTRPVENISYNDVRGTNAGAGWPQGGNAVDADSFLGRLRAKTGNIIFDLPTEAQWEFACRAGTTTALNSGKDLTAIYNCPNMAEVGRYRENKDDGKGGYSDFTQVGSYLPNDWGIYDMHGNIQELCLDWYGVYATNAVSDPYGAITGTDRVLRGGSHRNSARDCRSAYRQGVTPASRYKGPGKNGFRLVVMP